uniref:Cadherin domain-containing protein n=1 Tax=Echeneis naucrates TaxID=173247 RepID=A0A665WCA6_ECHNA
EMEVTASDPDKDADQEALRYSLHGQGAESEFIIDEVTGKIYAQRTLDREERAVWRFVVLATDEGGEGLTGFTDVIINVWDINDNAPVFTCAPSCHGDVAENSVVGTSVMEMTATDLDDSAVGQNAVLSYRIVGSLDGLFTIDQSGVLSVAKSLDREKIPQHHLVVIATDHGIPPLAGSATVQLSLLDVNDNGPEFEAAYSPVVFENVAGPQVVRLNQTSTLLRAMDRDSPENGPPFHFTIPSDYRYSNDFYLQDNLNGTATLTALRMFDRERQKEFLIPVIMSDSGRPAKTVTSTLTVTIGDQNDHAHGAGEKKIFINSHRGEKEGRSASVYPQKLKYAFKLF